MPAISKIRPFLWFPKNAREAAEFYASVFPDSSVDEVYDAQRRVALGSRRARSRW